jgi:hypothetical protein
MAETATEPRERRLGRYELVRHLATGGMGDVHLARMVGPAGFQRWVVVKVLLPELAPSARYRDMFLDEARLAARLAHANVCEVLDLGEEAGTYYIVMPYLDGVPLAALMQRPAALPVAAYRRLIAGVIAQACDGLHHAHQLAGDDGAPLGVVHRDVSPSNVMVLRDGVAKVVDFGIAKSRGSAGVTEKDVIKGKPAYMAPEQLAGGAIDRRADVFCVGILVWEALAQRPLFARPSSILSAKAVLDEPAPGLEADGVPAALAAVVARALAKEPYRRYETAAALRAALVDAVEGGPMAPAEIGAAVAAHWGHLLRAPPTAPQASEAFADTVPATGERTRAGKVPASQLATRPREAPPAQRRAGAVGVVVVGVAVAVTLIASRDKDTPKPRAVAPVMAAAPAPVPDAAPAPVAIVVDAAVATLPDAAPAPAKPRRGKGLLSVDSTPWATIYLDGKRLGITPMIGVPVKAGKHTLRAVTVDGREQQREVVIQAGAAQTPIRLHW